MEKLFEPFDWKKINDKEYCKQYEETREVNREECKKEVEAKYGSLYKKSLNPNQNINVGFLKTEIRKICEKYGFEDAYMSNSTFEIFVY